MPATSAPPMPPSVAPVWLRALVVGGLTGVLLLPLAALGAMRLFRAEEQAVKDVAAQVIAACESRDREGVRRHLLHPVSASQVPRLGNIQLFTMLRAHAVTEEATITDNKAIATFVFVSRELQGTFQPSSDRPSLDEWLPVELQQAGVRPEQLAVQDDRLRQVFLQMVEGLATTNADRVKGQRGAFHLDRIQDRWLVSAVQYPWSSEAKENLIPWNDAPTISTPGRNENLARQTFDRLAAQKSSRAEWEQSWQVDVDVQGRPASEVLKKLGVTSSLMPWESLMFQGMEIRQGRAGSPVLDKPVTLKVRGRSYAEVIEEVGRQVGLHRLLEPYGTGRLITGPRQRPVAFAGPFQVEVEGVTEYQAKTTGLLQLKWGSAEAVNPRRAETKPHLAEEMNLWRPEWVIDAVSDAAGHDLHHPELQALYQSRDLEPRVQNDFFTPSGVINVMNVPLRNLLKDVSALAEVRGRARIFLPLKADKLSFGRVVSGAEARLGNASLTVRASRLAGAATLSEWVVDFEGKGLDGRRLLVMAYVPDRYHGTYEAQPRDAGRWRLSLSAEPARLDCFAVAVEEVEYPFVLRDIPLPRAPQRLEPPRFDGHERPVAVEFQGIDVSATRPATLRVMLKNYSQKELLLVRLKAVFLDAAGRGLGEGVVLAANRSSVSPSYVPPPQPLQPSVTTVVEHKDVPAETTSVRLTPVKVVFADGTVWPP